LAPIQTEWEWNLSTWQKPFYVRYTIIIHKKSGTVKVKIFVAPLKNTPNYTITGHSAPWP